MLAKISQFTENNVNKIYHLQEQEIDIKEAREDTARMIAAVQHAKSAQIRLNSVLPLSLAQPLNQYAQWLNVKAETLLLTLLTTVSALHNSQTIGIVNRDWNFKVKPNLYGAIVAPPSQKKSPIVNTIADEPLKVLEKKARRAYKQQLKDYQQLIQMYESLDQQERLEQFPEGQPPAPPDRRKVYSFTKTTGEGLREQVKAYPDQGLLAIPDELAGLLKSLNVYRNGRGSDEEDLLSYYDGAGERVLRASGLAGDFDTLLLGILGTIQPEVLKEFLGNCQDHNGRWSRFMFVNQPLSASKMSADGGSFDLTPMLAELYEKVSQLPPQEYRPTNEAFAYYTQVYNELEQRRIIDPNSAMSAVWGKAEGRIGKVALNLHVIHELMAGRIPDLFIPRERYLEATQITLFFIQQIFSLYKEFGEAGSLPSNLTKVIELSKKKGVVSARDVMQRIDSKSRPKAVDVRSWFRELEAMGYGETSGEGRSLRFRYLESGEVVPKSTNSSTDEMIDWSSFQPNVEFVGEAGVFLHSDKYNRWLKNQESSIRQPNPPEIVSPHLVEKIKGGQVKDSATVISQHPSTISTSTTIAHNQVITKDVAVDYDVDNNSTADLVNERASTFVVDDVNLKVNDGIGEVDLAEDIWGTDEVNSESSQPDEANQFNGDLETESVNHAPTVERNGNGKRVELVESNFNSNRTPLQEYQLISELENCDKIETLHLLVQQYPSSIVKSGYNSLNQAKQEQLLSLIHNGSPYLTSKGVLRSDFLAHFRLGGGG